MVLHNFLTRAVSTRERKSDRSTSGVTRSSSLTAFFGSKKERKPSHIALLRKVLSTSVSDPALKQVLANLPSSYRRGRISRSSSDLCSAHAGLSKIVLEEISNLLTYELHRRLAHLYEFPRKNLSHETQTYLYQTLRPYRIYFREQPHYHKDDVESTLGAFCLACTLSLFFQDKAAVEALAKCAKSRRHRGSEWPPLLNWLEQEKKGKDWEAQWKRDGENMRRDRRKAQLWRRCGGGKEDANQAVADKGKLKQEKLIREEDEELDEEAGDEIERFQAWLQEQKERAQRFSAEGNHPSRETTYVEIGMHPNPFADSNRCHAADEGEYHRNPFSDPFSDTRDAENRWDEQEQKQKAEQEAKRLHRTRAYENLTRQTASPSIIADISQEEYKPAEWRQRRR